ncbi:hypothetical protein C0993_009940 [Termitomyces sp. T159_Od127]|nr:hypothetical protein C0993_009940 [Termitomyces sp. T159_Od127]
MPAPPYQPPPYVLSPSLSPQNPSTQYLQMQPTYSLASIPRGVTSFGDYDAQDLIDNNQVQDYEQDIEENNIYADGVANYQYESDAQPLEYWPTVPVMSAAPAHPQPVGNQLVYTSRHPQHAQWGDSSISTSTGPSAADSSYSSIHYSYMPTQETSTRRSRSSEVVPSPYSSSHLSPPQTPNLVHIDGAPPHNIDGHREQLRLFREALLLPIISNAGPFVPQKMYMPHTNSDRRRYVEEIELQKPIYFWMDSPNECGISLIDALHSRVRRLQQRDEPVFEGRGPSISVRIQWPGYRPWSRQIPTKDFRSPPQPITKAKLAKNIAKCVERFLSARMNAQLEDEVDPRWKVGPRNHEIKLEDLYLVSMHHVSMGSWQPQLRLRRPLHL